MKKLEGIYARSSGMIQAQPLSQSELDRYWYRNIPARGRFSRRRDSRSRRRRRDGERPVIMQRRSLRLQRVRVGVRVCVRVCVCVCICICICICICTVAAVNSRGVMAVVHASSLRVVEFMHRARCKIKPITCIMSGNRIHHSALRLYVSFSRKLVKIRNSGVCAYPIFVAPRAGCRDTAFESASADAGLAGRVVSRCRVQRNADAIACLGVQLGVSVCA